MNGWVIFAGLVVAFFVGVILERASLLEVYEIKLEQKNIEVAIWKRNYRELLSTEGDPTDNTLDELLSQLPDASYYVQTFGPGQDPRD